MPTADAALPFRLKLAAVPSTAYKTPAPSTKGAAVKRSWLGGAEKKPFSDSCAASARPVIGVTLLSPLTSAYSREPVML